MNSVRRLADRRLISLTGEGSIQLLHSLCAQDLTSKLSEPGSASFSVFLNPVGRVLFESILYRPKEHPSFPSADTVLVDIHKSIKERVLAHLVRYKLRGPVTISDTEMGVLCSLGSEKIPVEWFRDPRYPVKLPERAIVDEKMANMFADSSVEYKRRRLCLGVPEGPKEIQVNEALPIHNNFDLMNGISFNKGCFVGQELTTRTMRRGVVRRRVVSLSSASQISVDSDVVSGSGLTIGKVIASEGQCALAMIQTENGDALNEMEQAAHLLSQIGPVTVNGVAAQIVIPGYFYKAH